MEYPVARTTAIDVCVQFKILDAKGEGILYATTHGIAYVPEDGSISLHQYISSTFQLRCLGECERTPDSAGVRFFVAYYDDELSAYFDLDQFDRELWSIEISEGAQVIEVDFSTIIKWNTEIFENTQVIEVNFTERKRV